MKVPNFARIVKRDHRIYKEEEISQIMDYLSTPELPFGAITKISRDTGIPKQTLSDWRQQRLKTGN